MLYLNFNLKLCDRCVLLEANGLGNTSYELVDLRLVQSAIVVTIHLREETGNRRRGVITRPNERVKHPPMIILQGIFEKFLETDGRRKIRIRFLHHFARKLVRHGSVDGLAHCQAHLRHELNGIAGFDRVCVCVCSTRGGILSKNCMENHVFFETVWALLHVGLKLPLRYATKTEACVYFEAELLRSEGKTVGVLDLTHHVTNLLSRKQPTAILVNAFKKNGHYFFQRQPCGSQ
mmetsp:Transcript_89719/g.145286  ORF Transcript_89719/g.145286 Transcript_89719/m.145286 type:complete len:234 (-) Transcript_89719:8-709(-)